MRKIDVLQRKTKVWGKRCAGLPTVRFMPLRERLSVSFALGACRACRQRDFVKFFDKRIARFSVKSDKNEPQQCADAALIRTNAD
ncbi:MAG: hypothetical protein J1F06_03210 [Prevotellaceae bacterium]|nr:hypothetical protein [Prevotellaceae bacterium]